VSAESLLEIVKWRVAFYSRAAVANPEEHFRRASAIGRCYQKTGEDTAG
jgi:hypothetical protein